MIDSRKFKSKDKPVAPIYHNSKSLIIILRDLIILLIKYIYLITSKVVIRILFNPKKITLF
jgi:hypothetical protein